MDKYVLLIYYSSRFRAFAITFLVIVTAFFLSDKIFPLETAIYYSPLVKSSEGIVLNSFLSRDDKWRFYTPTSENSKYLKQAIIYKEDKYFYLHFGFNPFSLIRAIYLNISSGRVISGGSTITMQTSRLLYPAKRTYLNKLKEVFRSIQLEFHFSKDEILDLYLNKIPFGGNIEGTGAASVLYFGKNPDKLSPSESAALAVIPNNPNFLNLDNAKIRINNRKNQLLKKLNGYRDFFADLVKDALREDIEPLRSETPNKAPHFARRAVNENPGKSIINSTIKFTLQSRTEEIVSNYAQSWKGYGINNASVLIIDNRTLEIIAYVGSNDFADSENSGQVDGIQAVRSPGSALKPLLYALLTDKGKITPKMTVLDVPILNPDYSPGNFDGKYRGRVTVEYALSQSLNVPAVNLLNEFGYRNFISTLTKMNFESITKNNRSLGLSMILGGCGVTLEELTSMYTIFAHNGIYQKPHYISTRINKPNHIISSESAYIISEILTKPERPDLPQYYQSAKGVPIIAWKTGTSQGRRDGWAVGFNDAYTIGVWTGNFSGQPNSAISGANVAVPLLFEIFNSTTSKEKRTWLRKPDKLALRLVDATTGLLPSEFTKSTVQDYYISGITMTKTADHLKPIWISDDESISFCSDCLPANDFKQKIFEIYDTEFQIFMRDQKIIFAEIPPHNPNCNSTQEGNPPKILSPSANSEYYIEYGDLNGISLKARSNEQSGKIYWFINDVFSFKSSSGIPVSWIPDQSGRYKITCTDGKAKTSEFNIKVKIY